MADKFNSIVNHLAECLKQISHAHPKYSVSEVIKGGSLGKGTATDHSDIDLVVFFNGLNSIDDLEKARPKLKELITNQIRSHPSLQCVVRWESDDSSYSVQCEVRGIPVDILPAFDALTVFGSPARVYKEMKRYPDGESQAAQEYSASLSTLQRDFVKHCDSRIKDAVRMLKDWSEENDVKIRSYCLELIAMDCYTTNMSKEELFRKCMGQLAQCHNLQISFNENYDSKNYIRFMGGVPYIMDPANPYMDVLAKVDTRSVSSAANKYLRTHR